MIAASIALAFALYFTATLLLKLWQLYIRKDAEDYTVLAVLSAISWGAFYYFTHAA